MYMARKLTKPRPEQGERLTRLRKNAGLSQTKLAEIIDVPQSNVAFWEVNDRPPPSEILPKLAEVLGVSIEEIIGVGNPHKKPGPKSKIERQIEAVKKLSRNEQQFISKFLEEVLTNKGVKV